MRSSKRFSQSGAYNWGSAYIKSYDFGGGAYNRGGADLRAGLQSSAYGIWNWINIWNSENINIKSPDYKNIFNITFILISAKF